jgi:hypothetical protein
MIAVACREQSFPREGEAFCLAAASLRLLLPWDFNKILPAVPECAFRHTQVIQLWLGWFQHDLPEGFR